MSTEEKMEQLLNDYGNSIFRMCFLLLIFLQKQS